MKLFKSWGALAAVIAVGALVLLPAVSVGAFEVGNPLDDVCTSNVDSAICDSQNDSADDLIDTLVNTLLFIVGALAVVMIIVGAIFYVTSNGDAGKVTKAKNTIMYAIVGLVIAFIAFAIVNWILNDVF